MRHDLNECFIWYQEGSLPPVSPVLVFNTPDFRPSFRLVIVSMSASYGSFRRGASTLVERHLDHSTRLSCRTYNDNEKL